MEDTYDYLNNIRYKLSLNMGKKWDCNFCLEI